MSIDFPGTGSAPMLPSGDPVLPDDLVGPYAVDTLADQLTGAQRDALMNGKVEAHVADMIESMLTSVATMVLTAVSKMDGGNQVIGDFQSLLGTFGFGEQAASADHAAMPPAPQASTAPTPTDTAPEPAAPPEEAPSGPESEGPSHQGPKHRGEDISENHFHPMDAFRGGRDKGQNMTMGSVAKSITAPVAKKVSEQQRWFPLVLDDGTEVLRQIDRTTGETTMQMEAGDPGFDSMVRKVRVATGARSLISGVAAGEGVAGSVGMMATKVAGPVGLAIGAAQAVGGFAEKQEAAAQPFRSAFGEETSMFAAKERAGAWMAGLSGFGTIGGDAARENYMRATKMGLDGNRRDEATGFMFDMQRKFGLNSEQSGDIVSQATKQGNVALEDFAESITNVSRAAVAAGRSSKEAIDAFVATQANVAKNITTGPASIKVAESITKIADESLDRGLSESLGGAQGISEMLSGSNVMAMAALNGQDPMAATWALANPNTAAGQVNKTLTDIGEFIAEQVAGVLGMSKDELKKALGKETGGKSVAADEQYRIFEKIAGGPQQAGAVVSMVMPALNSFLGKPVDAAQMLNYLFAVVSGAFSSGEDTTIRGSIAKILSSAKPDPADADMGYEVIDPSKDPAPSLYGPNIMTPGQRQQQAILGNLGYGQSSPTGGGLITLPASDDAISAYIKYVAETGEGNASIESLLSIKNRRAILSASGEDAIEDVDLRITDSSGKKQDMAVADVISGGYMDQISSGTASVVGPNPSDLPTSLTELNITLSPEARQMFIAEQGPTEEQREGRSPGSTRSGTRYPSSGSRN